MAKPDNDFQIKFYEGVLRRNPADREVIELLGGLYTKEGRVDEGLRMDRRLVRLAPENPIAHYNLACSLALKRRKACVCSCPRCWRYSWPASGKPVTAI